MPAKTRSKAKKSLPRKRKMAKKPAKRKTRKTTKKPPTDVMRSLATYHDPFARLTNQPRIPDGKVTASMGHQLENVKEFSTTTGAYPNEDGVMHMLLYPGQDAALVVGDCLQGQNAYTNLKNYTLSLADGTNFDWSPVTGTGGVAQYTDFIAYWRIVSVGLRLALMNPDEANDGWFEACRVQQPLDSEGYYLSGKDGDTSATARQNGTISPCAILDELKSDVIVNQSSYFTGELRDLKKFQFNLHPIGEHRLIQRAQEVDFSNEDVMSYDLADQVASFHKGRQDVIDCIERHVDMSHDMIYIRIHGRTATPTRLLANVVSNQEVVYDNDSNIARYQHPAGTRMDIDQHADAKKKANGGNVVSPHAQAGGQNTYSDEVKNQVAQATGVNVDDIKQAAEEHETGAFHRVKEFVAEEKESFHEFAAHEEAVYEQRVEPDVEDFTHDLESMTVGGVVSKAEQEVSDALEERTITKRQRHQWTGKGKRQKVRHHEKFHPWGWEDGV